MQSYMITLIIVLLIHCIIARNNNTFKGFKISCKNTSPRCIQDSFQAVFSDFVRGIPSLGIESLDPFVEEKVNVAVPGGLAVEFNGGRTEGLSKCTINSASIIENRFNAVLHCNLTTKGKYRAYGKMLMFPIDGSGDATIVSKNLKFECSFTLGTTERKGKKYLVLKEHDIKHSFQGPIFYKITNLFKGNREISNMVLEYMNRNWHEVAEEFGDPIVNHGIQLVIRNVEKFIRIIPVDQLLSDY